MKKSLLLSIVFTGGLSCIFAQKEDNIWVFGYDSNQYPEYPGTDRITFNFSDSLTISISHGGMAFDGSNASICDSSGNLLLLSNSCYIENGDGVRVENSDSLNPGLVYENNCNGPYNFSYNANNNMVLLSAPDFPDIYYLFHTRTYFTIQPLVAFRDILFYTKIDMSYNNGHGKVLFKNKKLIADTLNSDGLHAVRHANGRDWWIVTAKTFSNTYYLLLLTPDGIKSKKQSIGDPTWSEAGGEIVFSPDGTKLARFNTRDDLRILDFDRCTGTLSNSVHIGIQDNTEDEVSAGLAFSADGHYLYAAEVKRLLQFDMWAPDIGGSMVEIAPWESSPDCSLGRSIGFLELGPDGRVYCRPLSGQECMHRIARPELSGKNCGYTPFYYKFDFSYKNLPHFPNFRLGPVDGSPCDTLGLDNHPLANWRYDKTGGLGVDFTSVSWYEPTLWQWDFGDPASGAANNSNDKNPSHTFSAPGGYDVCLTVSNPYGSDTKCKMVYVSTVSSGEPQDGGEVRIYPNPTSGVVFLATAGEVQVRVFNQLGQLQLEKSLTSGRLDLMHLPPGLYRLQVFQSGRAPVTHSVVLQNR